MKFGWTDVLILTPLALVLALLAFAFVDAVYEVATCQSRVFVDDGPHYPLRCVTDPKELERLKPYLHAK